MLCGGGAQVGSHGAATGRQHSVLSNNRLMCALCPLHCSHVGHTCPQTRRWTSGGLEHCVLDLVGRILAEGKHAQCRCMCVVSNGTLRSPTEVSLLAAGTALAVTGHWSLLC